MWEEGVGGGWGEGVGGVGGSEDEGVGRGRVWEGGHCVTMLWHTRGGKGGSSMARFCD